MKKLRLAYFGSPDFSARFLEKLHADQSLPIEIALVVTQEDKIRGRDSEPSPNAVKAFAKVHGIDVAHSVSEYDCQYRGIELAIVFAYGKIIKPDLLRAPKHGFWNIHPSLLPNFRGSTPVAYPLMLGNDQTGVSLMLMDDDMDHGPIIEQQPYPISPTVMHHELLNNLADMGYSMLTSNLLKLAGGDMNYAELPVQNHSVATFTRMLKRDDGYITPEVFHKALNNENLTSSEFPLVLQQYLGKNNITEYPIPYAPYIVYNLYRGLHPWPGVWTHVNTPQSQRRLKLLAMKLEKQSLIVEQVQLEGKAPVSFDQFRTAYRS